MINVDRTSVVVPKDTRSHGRESPEKGSLLCDEQCFGLFLRLKVLGDVFHFIHLPGHFAVVSSPKYFSDSYFDLFVSEGIEG